MTSSRERLLAFLLSFLCDIFMQAYTPFAVHYEKIRIYSLHFMQAYNTVGSCVLSVCNNTKDEENDFPIHHAIPFYGDSRPKASKEDESGSLS